AATDTLGASSCAVPPIDSSPGRGLDTLMPFYEKGAFVEEVCAMKPSTAALALLLCASAAGAQDRLPRDEARAPAKLIMTAAAAKKVKLPLDVQPDTDKPYANRKDEYGAMFLPDKRLTAERLEKAGKDLVPVALLWTHRLGPVSGGKVVSSK